MSAALKLRNLAAFLVLWAPFAAASVFGQNDVLVCPKFVACEEHLFCDECIRFHPCCNWCFDKDYNGTRCSTKENLSGCTHVEGNSRSSFEIKKKKKLADVEKGSEGAVQITPQLIKLRLRKNDPVTVQIKYRLAKNYPLDLYYLMDLTYTMSRDVETMAKVGQELADVLHTLTANHRLAFGAYSDKVALPFYDTSYATFDNPCAPEDKVCEPGFDFSHHLNFTGDIGKFIGKINATKTTANLDNLEGGFDALMQIMLCGRHMGWQKESRKMILVATDAILHMAGDGVLAGAVKRNVQRCLLDARSRYRDLSLAYDYPSLEEVYRTLLRRKMNVVFAVKGAVRYYYDEIWRLIPDVAYVVDLEDESANIIDVISEGYHNFVRSVRFFVNTTSSPELRVGFASTCGTAFLNRTDACYDVKEGHVYTFDVTFELLDYTKGKEGEQLTIEEKSISEEVGVEVDYVGSSCRCLEVSDEKPREGQCDLSKGEWKCNQCYCFKGWTGPDCTEACDVVDLNVCRTSKGNRTTTTCNSRGNCICGKCECDFGYTGRYCEYRCPVHDRQVCSGKGSCHQGKCSCDSGFTGEACSCPESQENCKPPGQSAICSDKGECRCGKCTCPEGFYGRYCEKCKNCDGLCKAYVDCVLKGIESGSRTCGNTDGSEFPVELLVSDESLAYDEDHCYNRYENREGETCELYFRYTIGKGFLVRFTYSTQCWQPIKPATTAIIVLAGVVVLGIAAILFYKTRIFLADRREWKKFEEESKLQREKMAHGSDQNPLYNSPNRVYEMPQELRVLRKRSGEEE